MRHIQVHIKPGPAYGTNLKNLIRSPNIWNPLQIILIKINWLNIFLYIYKVFLSHKRNERDAKCFFKEAGAAGLFVSMCSLAPPPSVSPVVYGSCSAGIQSHLLTRVQSSCNGYCVPSLPNVGWVSALKPLFRVSLYLSTVVKGEPWRNLIHISL